MKIKFKQYIYVQFCVVVVMLAWFSAHVLAAKGKGALEPVSSQALAVAPVHLTLGKAQIVKLPGRVADVFVANPALVDVQAIKADRLYVVGLDIGDTNLIALDEHGDVLSDVDLHVTYDLDAINGFLSTNFPEEHVWTDAIHDQIILMGEVSNPDVSNRIVRLVAAYVSELQGSGGAVQVDEVLENLMKVRGQQQVMLKVRIVEASRNALRELGLQTTASDILNTNNVTLSGAAGDGVNVANDPAGIFSFVADEGFAGFGALQLVMNALEQENMVSVLAEPNLTAISGQQAGFLAGGEFPVPVGRDQVGNLIVEFREFGVSLNFRPTVLSSDRINLNLNTEVSSLDYVNVVNTTGGVIPGLDVRRAETTVEVPSGASLMIAGLLQSDALEGLSGLPGIKDTPVLGDLISSKNFERNETELVVIITPYLVEPYKEKSQAKLVTKARDYPLARMFANNLRQSFDIYNEDLLVADESFGYILD